MSVYGCALKVMKSGGCPRFSREWDCGMCSTSKSCALGRALSVMLTGGLHFELTHKFLRKHKQKLLSEPFLLAEFSSDRSVGSCTSLQVGLLQQLILCSESCLCVLCSQNESPLQWQFHSWPHHQSQAGVKANSGGYLTHE